MVCSEGFNEPSFRQFNRYLCVAFGYPYRFNP